ncbi:HD family hydrolase [Natronomonas pharaonis DSM 2160]|uniref:HD family hydrolase n=1 Tax=Natronomonas pharaonis (strain ATCC 35678 / DSM 2160 / CIP 103997 / JCM 8858 / NBRC 14720 / NCIMB 2260 / Gabara) TaxID=348780 RepID=A0A1U7EXS4_NATPD|nr:HD domain-containing protein [Natronomonas pharaonis]CAI50021.1 HD family hydrolase [Natronomonas pharaonis DSM 2160]
MNDLEQAIDLAVDAYAGQTDKANETYIRHPLRVMDEMDTERERVVAVLHDVVEDANYTLEVIEQEFGPDIRNAVDALTKREDESYMEFVERAAANPTARKVKIADIEDNMDLTRLDSVNESVLEKQETYHEAWIKLQDMDQAEETTN